MSVKKKIHKTRQGFCLFIDLLLFIPLYRRLVTLWEICRAVSATICDKSLLPPMRLWFLPHKPSGASRCSQPALGLSWCHVLLSRKAPSQGDRWFRLGQWEQPSPVSMSKAVGHQHVYWLRALLDASVAQSHCFACLFLPKILNLLFPLPCNQLLLAWQNCDHTIELKTSMTPRCTY